MTLRHRSIAFAAGLALWLGACGGDKQPSEPAAPEGQPQAVSKPESKPEAAKEAKAAAPADKPKAAEAPKKVVAAKEPGPAKPARVKQPEMPPFEGHTVAVVHTANMVGEIEPCG